jgi:hypothetical protein
LYSVKNVIRLYLEKRQPFQSLNSLPVSPGFHLFNPQFNLSQNQGFFRFNSVKFWKIKYKGKQEDEPWYLLTNLPDLKSALKIYGQRYGREAMFKDCTTGGYNERRFSPITWLIALRILIALAMTSAWLQGKITKLQGQLK